MLRFLAGLAAFTYTVSKVPVLGWLILIMAGLLAAATIIAFWPLLLVLVIVVGTWWLAVQVLRWDAQRKARP